MNDLTRRTRAALAGVLTRRPPVPATTPVGAAGRDDRPDPRFDTGNLELLEDSLGFDPYANAAGARSAPGGKRQKTDLRALSAQILAERARKQASG